MTAANSKTPADYQEEGYTAYLMGKKPQLNPYRWGTDQAACRAWNAGYAAARTDRKKANRRKRMAG